MQTVSIDECRRLAEQLVARYGSDVTRVLDKYPEHVADGVQKILRAKKREKNANARSRI